MSVSPHIIIGYLKQRGLPAPELEYKFHPTRKFRFDFAFVPQKLAIEIEGGAFMRGGGRHNRGTGFSSDCEKYSEAAILGWRLLRSTTEQVSSGQLFDWIERALANRETG